MNLVQATLYKWLNKNIAGRNVEIKAASNL
jgi:hypothetical protein